MPVIPLCHRFRFQQIINVKLYSKSVNSNLLNLLKTMPKERKHIAEAQKQRNKIKEKLAKYAPGRVVLQVLGTGAKGAPGALYLFSDQSRYLFNCGEGTQRLAHEHKMKLAKLEHIFITQPVWKNIGGLPGAALTLQDVGVPQITLHGPQGLEEIFVATRRFVILKDLTIKMADCCENFTFEDNVMKVKYVPLTRNDLGSNAKVDENSKEIQAGSTTLSEDVSTSTRREGGRRRRRSSSSSSKSDEIEEDNTDYYAHERKIRRGRRRNRSRSKSCDSGTRTAPDVVSMDAQQLLQATKQQGVSMSYICRLQPRPGALNLDKCVEMGVPPGPLLGKLKGGESVVLANGKTVLTKDVCEPDDPGPVFIVVDCPSEDYLDSLLQSEEFEKHQASAKSDEDLAYLVVHFSPKHVIDNAKYKNWIDKFSPSTQHLIVNGNNTCMGSLSVHKIQHKLNLLSDDLFPLLGDTGMEIVDQGCSAHVNKKVKYDEEKPQIETNGAGQSEISVEKLSVRSRPSSPLDPYIFPNTFCSFHLRPKKGLDRSLELKITPSEYIQETITLEKFPEVLEELKQKLNLEKQKLSVRPYPKVLFLGTGSCIPNKTRNTSGILLETSPDQNLLLDCGEGTYGQIVRFFGQDKSDEVLANIKAIYVSHLHADHHIGLLGVLQGRQMALRKLGREDASVVLFGPKQILSWLHFYDKCFENIRGLFQLIPNGDLLLNNHLSGVEEVFGNLDLTDISTCFVRHCPNAFGVAFTHKSGYKITYSGDTMPSESLIELGKNSDVLIHEATMEDELAHEAVVKMHSTTSQAIEVGRKMEAKSVLLTHFSQRYAKLPRFNDNFAANVGIAFDNMQVRLDELSVVPYLYPALKLMFAEHYEELEHKAVKRQLKVDRERQASLDRSKNEKSAVL